VLNVGKYSLALSLTDDPAQAFDAFKEEEASGWVDWLAVGSNLAGPAGLTINVESWASLVRSVIFALSDSLVRSVNLPFSSSMRVRASTLRRRSLAVDCRRSPETDSPVVGKSGRFGGVWVDFAGSGERKGGRSVCSLSSPVSGPSGMTECFCLPCSIAF